MALPRDPGLWVFKPERARLVGDERDVAARAGIDPDRPGTVRRSLASGIVASALGGSLIPAILPASSGSVSGTVSELVVGLQVDTMVWTEAWPDDPGAISFAAAWLRHGEPGEPAALVLAPEPLARLRRLGSRERRALGVRRVRGVHAVARDLATMLPLGDAALARGLVALEWLDALLGQIDRHNGNIVFVAGADGAVRRVAGIDQDLSFGARLDGAYLRAIRPVPSDARPAGAIAAEVGLPVLADAALGRSLVAIDPSALDRELAPLLTAAEREALASRLLVLRERLAELDRRGRVLAAGEWSRPAVARLLASRPSYYSRLLLSLRLKDMLGEPLLEPGLVIRRLGLDLGPPI